MDLSNSSFIVSTAQGNLVVNPQSTIQYKNITLSGNGYYDWGRIIAQDLAYVADQLANLADGGVQQATFDANQFIAQFQAAQTQALTDHTTNLLLAIDNKIATKFAVVNSDLTNSLEAVNTHFTTMETNYVAADTDMNLSIRNDLNAIINTKIGIVQGNIDSLTTEYTAFHDDTQLWRSTVQPLITSFSSNFDVFKSDTQSRLGIMDTTISDNYDNLNNKIITITSNVAGNNAAVLANAELYTDGKVSDLTATISGNHATETNLITGLDNRITITESEIGSIQSQLPSFITNSNTILADSKTYTNSEIAKISGTNGTLTNLITTVSTLDTGITGRIHNIVDGPLGTLTTNVAGANTALQAYINSNDSIVSANNNDMLTKNNDITGRVSIIESTYPALWEADATTKANVVDGKVTALGSRVTVTETEIDALSLTVSNLNNTVTTTGGDVSSLTPRVTALENTRATTTAMTTADAATLASAKSYTDGKVTTLNTSITNGDTSTLTSAKSYTDGKINAITLTIPDKTSTDAAVNSIGYLTGQITNINTNSIPGLSNTIGLLTTSTTKMGVDIRTEYNSKIDSLSYSLSNGLNFIKENFVTYDTIYPILKTILGFIINNQITQSELNELIDNIMAQYKNESSEMSQSNINGAVFMTATKYNIRLILNKETYRNGIVSIYFADGSVSKSVTSFESNTSSNVLPDFANTNFLMSTSGDVLNNSIQFDAGLNIDNLVVNIIYQNELGFNVSEKYNINTLYQSSPFTFKDLYKNNSTGKLELYLELFGPTTDIVSPTKILADGVELNITNYNISGPISYDGYYSKTIKVVLSNSVFYDLNSPLSEKIELITIPYTSITSGNQTAKFNIPELLKYSIGGTN